MQLPLQHLLSCWGFSSLGHGVSPHSLSITAQLPLQLHTAATHTQKNYTKMIFTTQIITMVLTTHLEPYVLECEVKWALGNITMNKASRGDGIPVELFQILEDDAVKVMHSVCQKTWKTQQWPQDGKRSVFIPIPKNVNAKECSNFSKIALISHASKVMLKILQARLQQYMNQELPDVQAGFRKGRGTRDQITNIIGSLKKQESSRKTLPPLY